MDILLAELQRRWSAMFDALARGEDVPPARALRTEGLMEALVLAGQADAGDLDAQMGECYRGATGRCLADDLGDDWRAYHPFPEIPLWMRRAPVVPSTAD